VTRIIPVLLLVPVCAFAQTNTSDEQGPWPLFVNQNTLQVRIEAPLTTLMRVRSDTEYLDGTFAYTDASGDEHLLDLKLRARGRYRRQKDTCDFPPVRLNFDKEQVTGTEFAGQDKLKLVTHCENGKDSYEQFVLKEYLAYKIFNVMTDYSFGARLLRVTYVDNERGGQSRTRYGFVIEDDELLAKRIGGELIEGPGINYDQLDSAYAALVSVFEYLIGNTDYSLIRGAKDDDCCHNAVLFSKAPGGYLAIPYDFDFSGIVNTPYAEPNPKLPIRNVTRRLYRGLCEYNGNLDATLTRFREKETEINEIVVSLEGLDDKSRDRASKYVDGFYEDISDVQSVDSNLIRKCLSAG
jgi:hypothetical protein